MHRMHLNPAVATAVVAALLFMGYTQHMASRMETLLTKGVAPSASAVSIATTKDEDRKNDEALKRALSEVPGIDKVVEMNTKKIRAIRDKEGKVMYLVDNGRFAFVGDLIDVWQKKKLETLEEVDWAFNRIDLKKLGFELSKYNHITFGKGSQHVTAFVDPTCPWCQKLLKEVESAPELLNRYTFDFVIVGFLGEKAKKAAKAILCSDASANQKIQALAAGVTATPLFPQTNQTCDEKPLQDTQLVAGVMGVQSVPYLIAPDGRFTKGKPTDLKAWLENKTGTTQNNVKQNYKAPERPQLNTEPLKKTDVNGLNKVSLGSGAKHVTVFVDPQCGYCHKSIREIEADKELLAEYTFDFVFVAILGPESGRLVKLLDCANASSAQKLKAFQEGKKAIESLTAMSACEAKKAEDTEALRKAMNIRSAPVFVTDTGKATTGKPNSIRDFLGFVPKSGKQSGNE